MRNYSTIIILVLLLMNTYTSTNSSIHIKEFQEINSETPTNSDIISITQDKTVNQNPNNFETNMWLSGNYSQNIDINDTTPTQINPNQYERNLEITLNNAFSDLFQKNSFLFTQLNNTGTGSMQSDYSNQSSQLNFSVVEGGYSSYYAVDIQLELTGNEKIELNIKDFLFDHQPDDLAFASIVFSFDTYNMILIYDYTQSYLDFGLATNTSGTVKILRINQSNIILPISDISQQQNETYPNKLKSITWNVYSNAIYNYYTRFERFALIRDVDMINLSVNSENVLLSPIINYTLPPNETLFLGVTQIGMNIELTLNYSYKIPIILIGMLTLNDVAITLSATLSVSYLSPDYNYYLSFPDGMEIQNFISNQTQNYEIIGNTLNFKLVGDYIYLEINLLFLECDCLNFYLPIVMQGKYLTISNFTSGIDFIEILHSESNDQIQLTIENNQFSGLIPNNWSRGKVTVWAWGSNGFAIRKYSFLNLSPSLLVNPGKISIHPAEKTIIPINLLNITSNEIIEASQLVVYYQDQLYSVFDNTGIVIFPGDFKEGTHLLSINASSVGLVPVSFQLEIIIQSFNPIVSLEVTRLNQSNIEIQFSIPEIINWTIDGYLSLSDNSNQSKYLITKTSFTINLQSHEFPFDDFKINATIILQYNISKFFFQISIPVTPPLGNDNTTTSSPNPKSSGNSDYILIILSATISSGSILSYKYIKSKNNPNKINF